MARELFHIMRTDTLRVFVNVPQAFATDIQAGQDATVYREEEPGKRYPCKVTRTADVLDPATRTLLTRDWNASRTSWPRARDSNVSRWGAGREGR